MTATRRGRKVAPGPTQPQALEDALEILLYHQGQLPGSPPVVQRQCPLYRKSGDRGPEGPGYGPRSPSKQ